jgi:hypothetical protein
LEVDRQLPVAVTEPGKNYRWGEFQRGNEPKRCHIHNALHSHTTITQIMAKTLQSHIMAKSRRETQDVTLNLKIKLAVLDQFIHTLQNTNN